MPIEMWYQGFADHNMALAMSYQFTKCALDITKLQVLYLVLGSEYLKRESFLLNWV